MARFWLCLFVLHLCASIGWGKDWLAEIKKLERQSRTKKTVQQIAVCCNNLALEYERDKDWKNAERYMRKAYDLDRSEKLYHENLAHIYASQAWDLYSSRASRHKGGSMHSRAKLLAQRALSFDRNLADAHMLLGRIAYDNQDVSTAKKEFLNVRRVAPSYPGIDEQIDKVNREAKVEKKFTTTRNSFFEIRYSGKNLDKKTANGLKLALDVARQTVGKDYNFRPKHKTVVLIYGRNTYQNLKLGPHWSGGMYDGKIRLPLDGEHNLKFAVATLFHEYTHAVIDDLARSNCPRWLNEGLAEIQERKIDPQPDRALPEAIRANRLVNLRALDNSFRSNDTWMVALAYEQSHSVANYVVERYGYRGVKRILSELANDVPIEIAIRKSLRVSMTRLEADWRSSLQEEKVGRS